MTECTLDALAFLFSYLRPQFMVKENRCAWFNAAKLFIIASLVTQGIIMFACMEAANDRSLQNKQIVLLELNKGIYS